MKAPSPLPEPQKGRSAARPYGGTAPAVLLRCRLAGHTPTGCASTAHAATARLPSSLRGSPCTRAAARQSDDSSIQPGC
eukprot:366348-Chlamydomonas_euryale.AAC.11